MKTFHALIIGDEILAGRRTDCHFPMLIKLLARYHLKLNTVLYLPDERETLTAALAHSLKRAMPTFVFGGIGGTPDDQTRQATALASGRPLMPHPEGTALIVARFGQEAYPYRIKMAEFPSGAKLIPNPVNGIAGFSLDQHHFFPGFPSMATPMAEWVVAHYYAHEATAIEEECILIVPHGQESHLTGEMEQLVTQFPHLSFSSLPSFGTEKSPYPHIELRIAGPKEEVIAARGFLIAAITQHMYSYEIFKDTTTDE
jgi:molybdopterin-biosynthesis enzyme MoeA-like protein